MRRATLLSGLACLLLACSSPGESATPLRSPQAGATLAEVADASPTTAHDLGSAYATGDPHVAPLLRVAAARGGSGALTLDQLGELRLWRALDGSRPPQRVAVDQVAGLSIEHDGDGSARRWRFALVDVTGGASIWEADLDSAPQLQFRLPPTRPASRVTVMPEGRGYLVLGRDGALEWLDLEGQLRQRIETPKFAASDLVLEGEQLMLVASTPSRDAPKLRALTYRFEAGQLEVQGEAIELAADPAQVHWDLRRGRAWYVESRGGEHQGQVRFTDLRDEGASKWISLPASAARLPGGLLASGEFALDWSTNGMLAVGPDGRFRGIGMRAGLSASSDWVEGRRYAAFGEHLVVEDETTSVYLGYRRAPSVQAAISPEGGRVAYAHPNYIDVEDDAGHVRRLSLEGEPVAISELVWLDAETLLYLTAEGGAFVVDASSGEQLDRLDLHGDLVDARFDAATGTLALRTQAWGTRSVLWTEGRRLGPQATVMDNGSFYGILPAAGDAAPGLWSFNGHTLRRYEADQLRDGLVHTEISELEENRPDSAVSMVWPLSSTETLWLAANHEQGKRKTALWRRRGEATVSQLELGEGNPTWIRVSADGQRAAILLTSSSGARVAYLVDLEQDMLRWKTTLPSDGLLEWAAGGEHLLMQSFSSGVEVWSAATGERLRARCAFEFVATPTRPTSAAPALDYLCG